MNFLDEIKEETLIICSEECKKSILNMHKLLPIKFMSPTEFIKKRCFTYDESAILYTMNKYQIKYEIAKEYIDNTYYIENKNYGIEKLDFLVNLKNELNNNLFLIYNDKFNNYLKNINIIIYDLNLDNWFYKKLTGLNYKIINRQYQNHTHEIFEFETMEDEVYYTAKDIASKISSGISPNKIKLTNIDESYYNTINRIFKLHGLKVNIKYKRSLSSYQIVKRFLELYKQSNNSIEEKIEEIIITDNDSRVYNKLIDTINKYLKYNNKELIIYKIENTYIDSPIYDNGIEIIDYLEYIPNDEEYIYMLNFNESIIPKCYTDTEYITDNIKEKLDLKTTKELNVEIKKKTIDTINNIRNLTITYKLKDYKNNYYPSTLHHNFEVIKKSINYEESFSETYNKMQLTKEYDNYFKYGYKSNNFDLLNNNYQIKYNSFSNKYTKIERNMDHLNLSYSKMQIYNKCPFRYYLSNILKLDIYEENYSQVIGNIVHFVMEKCLSNNEYDIEKYIEIFLQDKILNKKEKFFLEKYKQSIKDLLQEISIEKEYSSINNAMYEKKIDIDYGNNIHFSGIIDKILYKVDNNNTYIAIIDYKTGNDDISLKYLNYGINIQLPIYLYLTDWLELKNIKYIGFYLQKLDIIDKDYRLVGYSNSDESILSIIDNNYNNSKIIKGLKTLKDGSFSKYSKLFNEEDVEKIKSKVDNIIKNVISNIKANNFEINPKIDNGINISCEYCKFYDICFKQKTDETKIQNEKFGDE